MTNLDWMQLRNKKSRETHCKKRTSLFKSSGKGVRGVAQSRLIRGPAKQGGVLLEGEGGVELIKTK